MIDLERESLLTEFSKITLKERYLIEGETTSQEIFLRVSKAFSDSPEHAQRLYEYSSKLWLSFATPILYSAPDRVTWSDDWKDNFNQIHFHNRISGLPISCFLSHVGDSRNGLNRHYEENTWLSSTGGGIGSSWSSVRSNGSSVGLRSKSTGIIPFIGVMDRHILAFSQGTTRRGAYAAYLSVEHPEIKEFIGIRKPGGGDANRKALNIHNGVVISDAFMKKVHNGGRWHLKDPNSGEIKSTINARSLWELILETRLITGEPYILFEDTANSKLPQHLKDAGLRVTTSNLCSEIMLPTDDKRTAVCCLSSVNVLHYDEWKDNTQFIEDVVRFLDNVIEYFIAYAPISLSKAVYSASQERSVGLGQLGFHSYLQSKRLPFESAITIGRAINIQKHIQSSAIKASELLAVERGCCESMIGKSYQRRNSHLCAIAPNATSSIVLGCSPSIEPWVSNCFTHKTLAGNFTVRNQHLKERLQELGLDTQKTWRHIANNRGSVQNLIGLPDLDKEVFKTAVEIDQRWIVDINSKRQEYVCQGISTNLFFQGNVHVKDLHDIHYRAWKSGLKSLYYIRSSSVRRAENVTSMIKRKEINNNLQAESEACIACEG